MMSLAAWSVSNMTRRLVHENATKQVPIHPFSLPCKMEGYSQKVSHLNVVIWKVLKHEVQLFNCSIVHSFNLTQCSRFTCQLENQ